MKLEPFELERIQSEWEHVVDINLTESGVEPLTVSYLIPDEEKRREILDTKLAYSQTNGTMPLREAIASMYKDADAENVVVTNGGAEANFITVWNLLHEHDRAKEIVMMLPNYMQIYGVTKGLGGSVIPFYLKMDANEWVPDLEGLKEAVSIDTVAITICNPNNPTGATLGSDYLKSIADIAADAGVWILSDEIYQGAELEGPKTPTMFDYYDKVLVTNSLSKAYGLPGLRLGWVVTSQKPHATDLWSYSDYTSICPTKLSDKLATIALQPEMREKILERTSRIVKGNWNVMREWLVEKNDIFDYVAPRAASICFPKHNLPISSLQLVDRLLKEKSLLIIPGEHFGMKHYIRIGFGYEEEHLKAGLSRLDELLQTIK
ncbi:MAG: aminotransferase class I/II-fold pyridoxal phosphate-dependent enzyme [Candidatus Thorarchaeota archaeon]